MSVGASSASARSATADKAKADEPKPIQLTKTPFVELTPRISPDGRWIAYTSNEPGELRVYIQSFPEPDFKQLVSPGGGVEPRWSTDSKELYYYSGGVFPFAGPGATIMAVSVHAAGSSLSISAPTPRVPRGVGGPSIFSTAADGRFLLQTNVGGFGRGFGARPVGTNREYPVMTLILNWPGSRPGDRIR